MATLGKFEVYKTLGSGAFSKVKLGRHEESGAMAALKIMARPAVRRRTSINQLKLATSMRCIRLFARRAPIINVLPTMIPKDTTSQLSAEKNRNASDFDVNIASDAAASVPTNAPFANP